MFALLISTIQSQAASGDFDSVGTIESVELTSTVTSTGGSDTGSGGADVAKAAGIPAGVVGFLLIAAAVLIGYYVMKGSSDDDDDGKDPPRQSDVMDAHVVEAHAVVLEATEVVLEEGDMKKSKHQFL